MRGGEERIVSHRLAIMVLLLAVLPLATLSPGRTPSVQGASPAKSCKIVKKHGHKKKVCRSAPKRTATPTDTPAPTATPTATATPTDTPTPTPTATPTVSLQVTPLTGCPSVDPDTPAQCDPDITRTYNADGSIDLAARDEGYSVHISQLSARNQSVGAMVVADIRETKSPGNQGSTWQNGGGFFYLKRGTEPVMGLFGCLSSPLPDSATISDGQSMEGWACTDPVPPDQLAGVWTLYWSTGLQYDATPPGADSPAVDIPVAQLTVTVGM
jgi:hypothetical protein